MTDYLSLTDLFLVGLAFDICGAILLARTGRRGLDSGCPVVGSSVNWRIGSVRPSWLWISGPAAVCRRLAF
ncbi:MAG TPA: hypothetical protein VGK43_07310 [Solirubrobacterales bacterium]